MKKINYKPLNSYEDTLKNANSILNKDLRKYNFYNNKFNIQKSNEIFFDKCKRLVYLFKDHLLWNETSDFLKKYYNMSKSIDLLPNMCKYYKEFTFRYPNMVRLKMC